MSEPLCEAEVMAETGKYDDFWPRPLRILASKSRLIHTARKYQAPPSAAYVVEGCAKMPSVWRYESRAAAVERRIKD